MQAMKYIIETVLPLLGDSRSISNRQGAVELIYCEPNTFLCHEQYAYCFGSLDVVQELDIKALPYVIFLIVPILGRMSDQDDDVRTTATNTFASLVKMVPLEVSKVSGSLTEAVKLITVAGWTTRSTGVLRGHASPPGGGAPLPNAAA